MVTHTLTIDSSPQGIRMGAWALDSHQWITTPQVLTYEDSTEIIVVCPPVIGQPVGSDELGWVFSEWEDHSTDRSRTVTLSGDQTITATYIQQVYYPVRSPSQRAHKFFGKTDHEVIQARTTALKPMMVREQLKSTVTQTSMEIKVGKLLNSLDLFGDQLHHYRNFSQELWGLTRIYQGLTLNKEASLKGQKWATRGLDPTILQQVADFFNITLTLT
jgi:hypothetical protein